MIACRLTGMLHGDWSKVRETIGFGNLVTLKHVPEFDTEEGTAWQASYAGLVIGYIPLVPTLRGYYKEAKTIEERTRLTEWGLAATRVRWWLDDRLKCRFEEEHLIPVHTILYRDADGTYNVKDRGTPTQISLGFEDIE